MLKSVQVAGISTDLIEVEENASSPILLRLLVPVSSPEVLRTSQCWKACFPIFSIDDGMLMLLRDSQNLNASSSISLRPLPSIVTFVRAELQKACFPMYSTLSGIVIVVRELQLLKAYVSILVPFVIAYIFYAWRSIDRHKITEKEMDEGGHAY